jgi:hypothetical protein
MGDGGSLWNEEGNGRAMKDCGLIVGRIDGRNVEWVQERRRAGGRRSDVGF